MSDRMIDCGADEENAWIFKKHPEVLRAARWRVLQRISIVDLDGLSSLTRAKGEFHFFNQYGRRVGSINVVRWWNPLTWHKVFFKKTLGRALEQMKDRRAIASAVRVTYIGSWESHYNNLGPLGWVRLYDATIFRPGFVPIR